MVEHLNRQRVVKFLDAFYSGNIEGALACCSDDIDFIAHAPVDLLPHMGHRRGKAEVREMWQIIHARYSNMRYEISIIVAEQDKVALTLQAFLRKRSNERIVQIDIAVFWTFRNGRIAQIRQFLDFFDLVQQMLERDVDLEVAASGRDLIAEIASPPPFAPASARAQVQAPGAKPPESL